jgi:hypothetical protein
LLDILISQPHETSPSSKFHIHTPSRYLFNFCCPYKQWTKLPFKQRRLNIHCFHCRFTLSVRNSILNSGSTAQSKF